MKIKFTPQNIELEIAPNKSVLDLANENGIYIKSVCRGVPSCAECRIRIIDGEHNVIPPAAKELNLIGTAYFVDQRRLSCQLKCFGDITVDMTEQIEKQNQTVKRPRGAVNKDADESAARTGNIIFEEQTSDHVRREDEKDKRAEEALVKAEQKRELDRIRAKHRQVIDPKPLPADDDD